MRFLVVAPFVIGFGVAASGVANAANVSVSIGGAPSAAVVSAPVAVAGTPGWHGDQYYDGHRNWSRQEWDAHKRGEMHAEHLEHKAEERQLHAAHEQRHMEDQRLQAEHAEEHKQDH